MIKKNIANRLKNPSPITPQFYPAKIYKKGNLGRPVLSSRNCYASNISKYVDYHLQPIPKKASDNRVRSLCVNIPSSEGTSFVKRAFDN